MVAWHWKGSVSGKFCWFGGKNDKQQKRTNVRKDIYIEHTFVYNKRNDGGERNGVKTWSVDTGKTADSGRCGEI